MMIIIIIIIQHLQRGAKWFRFRVSIHHPLGLNWHPFEGPGLSSLFIIIIIIIFIIIIFIMIIIIIIGGSCQLVGD